MKDRVSFNIKNNRINFKFQIERNVTIISGDSGTGKTKLFNMVRNYDPSTLAVRDAVSRRFSAPPLTRALSAVSAMAIMGTRPMAAAAVTLTIFLS